MKKDNMTPAATEARRRYHREWNKRNPEKVRAARVRYWNKKAAEMAAAIAAAEKDAGALPAKGNQ